MTLLTYGEEVLINDDEDFIDCESSFAEPEEFFDATDLDTDCSESEGEGNNFLFQGIPMRLQLSSMVCNAPAPAFVKNVIGHSGYSGCEKCVQEGEHVSNRVTFPETGSLLRTDEDFRGMVDEGHHLGLSPLSNTSLAMVSGFPLDYMHLVCLGVMRRLLHLWLKGPFACRLSGFQVRTLYEKRIKSN